MEMRSKSLRSAAAAAGCEAGGREADEEAIAVIKVGEEEEEEEGLVVAIPKGEVGSPPHWGSGWVGQGTVLGATGSLVCLVSVSE